MFDFVVLTSGAGCCFSFRLADPTLTGFLPPNTSELIEIVSPAQTKLVNAGFGCSAPFCCSAVLRSIVAANLLMVLIEYVRNNEMLEYWIVRILEC